MVDEVENILREISDRVRAEQAMTPALRPNGAPAAESNVAATKTSDSSIKVSLARIDSYLTTTGRAWDRLPPVSSNRSGAIARLELWFKNLFKRATRWYSWEQVNFNAAVDHALRETLSALASLEEELQTARQQLVAERDLLSKRTEQIESALDLRRAEIDAQRKSLEHEMARGKELEQQLESQAIEIATQRAQFDELRARFSELSERSENLVQEQRVSFKQLSLEMTEVATLVDRRRREIETRLGKVEKGRAKS